MTRNDSLKKLLKINLNELKNNTCLNIFKIEFKGDEFIVINKNKKTILKDKLDNYDLDFTSQKKFILNVVRKVTSFAEDLNDLGEDYLKKLITQDFTHYFDIICDGYIFKKNYIKLNLDDLYLYDEDIDYNDPYSIKYYVKNSIKDKIDRNKIGVVLYHQNYEVGIYVDSLIKEDYIHIFYNGEDAENLIDEEIITLHYSVSTEKEVKEAVETIKKLVG